MRKRQNFDGEKVWRESLSPCSPLFATRFYKGDSSSSSPQTAYNQQTATSGSGTTIGARPITIGGEKSNLSKANITTGGTSSNLTGSVKGNVTITNSVQSEDAQVIATALGSQNSVIQGASDLINSIVTGFNNTIQHIAAPPTQPASTGDGGSAQPPVVGNVSGGGSVATPATGLTTNEWLLIGGIFATVAVGIFIATRNN